MVQIELIAEGYIFLEAPRVDRDNNLYFSDIQIGGVFKRSPNGKISHLIPDRQWIGGLALNADGRIVVSGDAGLVIFDAATGEREVLLDKVGAEAILAVNDIQPDGDGGLYLGAIDPAARMLGKSTPQPLIHLAANRTARRVAEGIKASNGIGLSPDRSIVYVVDTAQGVLAYDRSPDGRVSNRRVAVDHPYTDGITVDSEGYVWVAAVADSAIKRFTPDGNLDRRIDIPVKEVTSLTFGGEDLRDLYVVTGSRFDLPGFKRTGNVYRLRTEVVGQVTPQTRF